MGGVGGDGGAVYVSRPTGVGGADGGSDNGEGRGGGAGGSWDVEHRRVRRLLSYLVVEYRHDRRNLGYLVVENGIIGASSTASAASRAVVTCAAVAVRAPAPDSSRWSRCPMGPGSLMPKSRSCSPRPSGPS